MKKKTQTILIDVNAAQATKKLYEFQSNFETVYSEDEVRKFIAAIEKKYKPKCDEPLPYQMKPSKIIKGQI